MNGGARAFLSATDVPGHGGALDRLSVLADDLSPFHHLNKTHLKGLSDLFRRMTLPPVQPVRIGSRQEVGFREGFRGGPDGP
jgi:hypothetical protein